MLVTAGGGHDAHPMMSKVLAGLAAISVELRPDTTMITGPLMAADLRANLMAEGERLGVTVIAHTPHVKRYIEDADLVVTMGGYNSMIETMISGKPTLNIPRPGPSQEQSMRARISTTWGFCASCPSMLQHRGRSRKPFSLGSPWTAVRRRPKYPSRVPRRPRKGWRPCFPRCPRTSLRGRQGRTGCRPCRDLRGEWVEPSVCASPMW